MKTSLVYQKILLFFPAMAIIAGFLAFQPQTKQSSQQDEDFLIDPQIALYLNHMPYYYDKSKIILHLVWKHNQALDVKKYILEKSENDGPYVRIGEIRTENLSAVDLKGKEEDAPFNKIFYSDDDQNGFIYNELMPTTAFYYDIKIKYRLRAEREDGKVNYSAAVAPDVPTPRRLDNGLRAACPSKQSSPKGYTKVSGSTKTFTCDCGQYTTDDYITCTTDPGCTDCVEACSCTYDPCCQHGCSQIGACNCPGQWAKCKSDLVTIVSSVSTYSPPSVSFATTDNTSCSTCNGAVNLTAKAGSSGSTKFTYKWSTGGTAEDLTGLCGGSYSVTVTDEFSCSVTGTATVANKAGTGPTGTTTTVSAICTTCNGSIDLTPKSGSSGNTKFSFKWSNGPTSEDQSGLCSGSYTVTITDGTGCTGTANASVALNNSSTSGTTAVTDCTGPCNGSIDMTPKSGSGSTKFTYKWSNGSTAQDISGLCGGSYTVTITDEYGCTGTSSGSVSCILPVELTQFKAVFKNQVVMINWTTTSENNNDYFTVERSTDGNNFSNIQQVNGAGNSNQVKHYQAVDKNPVNGTSYYRLKQTDFNGTYSYSSMHPIRVSMSGIISVIPNPVKEKVEVSFFANEEDVELTIVDVTGKQIVKKLYSHINGLYAYEVDMSSYPGGIYYLFLKTNGQTFTQKLLKY